MKLVKAKMALAGIAFLSACDGDVGDLGGNRLATNAQADASAEGKAQDGRISMKGPGFDFAINLPGGIANRANVDDKIIYPGSTIRGVHIAAGQGGKGGVELRFASRDPLDKLVAWYRDPARKDGFTLSKAESEGGGMVFTGKTRNDDNDFKLHLHPKGGRGTEGRLTVNDRD